MKLYKLVAVVLLGVSLGAGAYWLGLGKDVTKAGNAAQKGQERVSTPIAPAREIQLDCSEARSLLEGERGSYAIYYGVPGQAGLKPMIWQSKPMRSASMIKVFIMAYAMDMASKGQLELDSTRILTSDDKVGGAGIICNWESGTAISVRQLITLMITESDNTATNMMIQLLGMDNINSYIKSHGYEDTVLRRKMMDLAAVAAGRENYSSVKDLGTIFSLISQGRCVSPEYDKMMVDIMLGQTDMECMPAAISGVRIAHKTGELDNLYDDGGIIITDKGNYVLVMMTDDISRNHAIDRMKQAASMIHSSFLQIK